MSWKLIALNLALRFREKRYLARMTDFAVARVRMEREAKMFPAPEGCVFRVGSLGGVPVARTDGPDGGHDGAPVLFWLHGGAYCIGSHVTHGAMAAALAARIGAGLVMPEYRLAPEHRFPAAIEDALAAWRGLAAEGVVASRIILGGDSAGGGLAFAALHALLAAGEAPPAAAVAFSPWVDLTGTAPSLRTLAWRDAMIPAERFAEIRGLYLGAANTRDPLASPLFGQFAGAPPVLIQSSKAEILRDDARGMAARLKADGVAVTHDEWPAVPHVWQMYQGLVPEADLALDRAARFLSPWSGAA